MDDFALLSDDISSMSLKFWARKVPIYDSVLIGVCSAVAAEVSLANSEAEQLRDWLTEYLTGQLIASHQPGNPPKPKTDTPGVND